MKETLFPVASAFLGKFSKSITLPKLRSLLLGVALLSFSAEGWTQTPVGTVVAWGDNRYGQTNVPPGLTNVVAIAVGEWHNMALKADGTLIGWGVNNIGQRDVPSDVTNVVAIATGGYHNLALKADGTVRAWGANEYGQSDVPAGLNNVVAVSGGWTHSVALKADGTVVAWGRNQEGQATVPFALNNVVAISAAEYHNLALKSDGTIVGWGWNGYGQTIIPASLSNNVVAISASGLHSMALKNDGTVVAWGWNRYGQIDVPADLNNVVAIRGGAEHSLALKADGTVVGWGSNTAWADNDPNCALVGAPPCPRKTTGQTDTPSGVTDVMAIAAGNFHSVALKANGIATSPTRFTLTTDLSPAGSGSINIAPASGDGKYDTNAVVTLTAVPQANKIFTGWSGAATGMNNPIQITMDGNKTLTATFAPAASTPTFTLTANASPSTGGTIVADPPGPTYASNTVVTLTAVPEANNAFTRWNGAATGTTSSIQITMNGNKTVTATFTPTVTLTANLTASVIPSSAGVVLAAPFSASGSYSQGTVVTLTAQPDGTNVFAAWSGDASSLSNQIDVVMNSNKTVTALFNNPGKFVFQHVNGKMAQWFLESTNRLASVMLNNGAPLPANWRLAGVGDMDNNGSKDYLFRGKNGRMLVWFMDGSVQTRTALWKGGAVLPAVWRVGGLADFNNDSKADLLLQNTSNGVLGVRLMDGSTNTSAVKLTNTIGAGWRVAATADFNNNNSPDIVFQSRDGRIALWLMNGYSRESSTLLRGGTTPGKGFIAVGATDIDEDGSADLIFQRADGIFKVWFMDGGAFLREQTLSGTVGKGWNLRGIK